MKISRKKIVLLVLLVSSFSFTYAQVLRFGLKAGFNTSSISGWEGAMKEAGNSLGLNMSDYSTSFKSGFNIGLIGQVELGDFFVEPELLFTQLGVKEEIGSNGKKTTETNSLNYLQVPVYAGYKFSAGYGLDVILGVGPYLGCGLSGTDNIFEESNKTGIKFKRFDAGLTFMGGIEISALQVSLGYDLGLVDMMDAKGWNTTKDIFGLSSICNRNIKVSVAYFF